jgi:hypothetical protein
VFMAAIGPLNSLVKKTPTCADCGAQVSAPPAHLSAHAPAHAA